MAAEAGAGRAAPDGAQTSARLLPRSLPRPGLGPRGTAVAGDGRWVGGRAQP